MDADLELTHVGAMDQHSQTKELNKAQLLLTEYLLFKHFFFCLKHQYDILSDLFSPSSVLSLLRVPQIFCKNDRSN